MRPARHAGAVTNPAIVLVSPDHVDFLLDEFGRYARDYDLHTATDVRGRRRLVTRLQADGDPLALMVRRLRAARRPPRWRRSASGASWCRPPSAWSSPTGTGSSPTPRALRPGLAKGKYDAYLLMPRGVRDEEFHTAVTELLSDWGSTVAEPEVETVRLVSPRASPLTLAIRDFLDRMGMPNRTYDPDTEVGREIVERYDGEPAYPLVDSPYRDGRRPVVGARRGRRPSTADPTTSTSTPSSTSASSAPARPGWPPRSTAPPRAWTRWSSRPRRSAARPAPAR